MRSKPQWSLPELRCTIEFPSSVAFLNGKATPRANSSSASTYSGNALVPSLSMLDFSGFGKF